MHPLCSIAKSNHQYVGQLKNPWQARWPKETTPNNSPKLICNHCTEHCKVVIGHFTLSIFGMCCLTITQGALEHPSGCYAQPGHWPGSGKTSLHDHCGIGGG